MIQCRPRGPWLGLEGTSWGEGIDEALPHEHTSGTWEYQTQWAPQLFHILASIFKACEDQLWGILARRIANTDKMLTDMDMVRIIRDECNKPGLREWIGLHTEVNVYKTHVYHGWREHMPKLGVKLEGGLLEDASGNHLFMSMLHQGR